MSEQLPDRDYEKLQIGKPGSKTRTVYRPSDELRAVHHEVLAGLRHLRIDMPFAYGGVRGRSLLDHVEQHAGHQQFYLLDLKDAFASVDISHLRSEMFHAVGPKSPISISRMSDFIRNEATIDGVDGLPLGLPASPMLFNIYCRKMDQRLGKLCRTEGITYTRWLDDLTFSSSQSPRHFDRPLRRNIRAIIEETPGMKINDGKAKLLSGKKPVTITGLTVYPPGATGDVKIAPSRELLDAVRATLEEARAVLDQGGDLSEDDMDLLHGYNSVLHMAGDPVESKSRAVRDFSEVYRALTRRAVLGSRRLTFSESEETLFDMST